MQYSIKILLAAGAVLAIAGCAATSPLNSAITDIGPVVSPQPCAHPAQVADAVTLINNRIDTLGDAVKDRLTADAESAPGAAQLLDAMLAALRAAVNTGGTPPSQIAAANNLTIDNIRAFADSLRQEALAPATARTPTAAEAQFSQDMRQFNAILVTYVEAYIQGAYVDRVGNKLPAPAFSSTVGDTEIAGILSVLMDAVSDFFLRTPIWVDNVTNPRSFYPPYPINGTPAAASNANQAPPTADSVMIAGAAPAMRLFERVALVNQPAGFGGACGIDAIKARAIAYLGQTAALKASTTGGLLAATVGGTGFSFVVFQKVSIGDSQTVRVMLETFLSKLAEHIATEAAYRALVNVNDAQYGDLADLLLYIAAHPQAPLPAKPVAPSRQYQASKKHDAAHVMTRKLRPGNWRISKRPAEKHDRD
jgi:hypothetical protein